MNWRERISFGPRTDYTGTMRYFAVLLAFAATPMLPAQSFNLPAQGYGLDVLQRGEERVFRLTLEYTLDEDRSLSADSAVAVPLPPASVYQSVDDVLVAGARVSGFGLDAYGNTVAILQEVDGQNPFTLSFSVHTWPIKTTLPEDYSYRSRPVPELAESFGYSGDVDFRSLAETREAIRTIAREEAPETFAGNLFDPDFLEFYPVSDEVFFLVQGSALTRTREETGITGRFVNGLVVPLGGDFFLPDFRMEYYVPGRGIASLRKNLLPLEVGGGFIALDYSFENRSWLTYALLQVDEENNRFLKGRATITLGPEGGEPLPLVHTVPLWYPGWGGQDFIVRRSRDPETAFTQDGERNYRDAAAGEIIDTVVLAQAYQSGQAVGEAEEFGTTDQVTAILRLKEPGADRHFSCRWIRPDGRTYYTWEYVPGATWNSFYTNINGNHNQLEKGLWRLEISVNGALDYRGHFTIR